MIDPLSVLRHYILNRLEIIESEHQFRFHEFAFDKKVQTNFFHLVVKGSSLRVLIKQYYSLECLIFLLKNVHLKHPEYVQRALAEEISIIRRRDRKVILAYLYGMIRSSNRIDEKGGPKSIPSLVNRSLKEEPGTCTVVNIPTKEEVNVQLVSIEREGQLTSGQYTIKEEVVDIRETRLSDVLTAEHIEAIKQKFQRARMARKEHNNKKQKMKSTLTLE